LSAGFRKSVGKERQFIAEMENSVSVISIVCMGISLLIGAAVPLILMAVLRKKYKCRISIFLYGCAVMLLFAFILEQLVHSLVLSSPVGIQIRNNIWFYGLYGGFMAGLFEESGRYLLFRFVLKNRQKNNYDALMYGAGHGGIEMFVLLSLSMINNLVYSIEINTGAMNHVLENLSGTRLDTMRSVVAQLTGASPWMFLVSPIERIAALVIQLSLSVLVWFAVKNRKYFFLYPLAIGLHMLVDMIAVIAGKAGLNIAVVEFIVYIFAACTVWIASHFWKKAGQQEA